MVSQGCSEHHEGGSLKFGEEALVDTWEDARRDSKNRACTKACRLKYFILLLKFVSTIYHFFTTC